MDRVARLRMLEKLLQLCERVSELTKEASAAPVSGLELVREDLSRGHVVHGQKHKQPINSSKVTPPTGMGTCSDSPNVGTFYQAGPNAHS